MDNNVKPFPFHMYRGDHTLAARLLYEHGLDTSLADTINPQVIEIMAATGKLVGRDAERKVQKAHNDWRQSILSQMLESTLGQARRMHKETP